MDNVLAEIAEQRQHDALVRQQPLIIQFGPINVAVLDGEFYVYQVHRCGFSVFETEEEAIRLAWQLSL